jgi:hypothetical protein
MEHHFLTRLEFYPYSPLQYGLNNHLMKSWGTGPFGLYYKHVMIVNYASSGVNKLRASLNDDARVIIYDRHMFIAQATGAVFLKPFLFESWTGS